MLKEGPHSATTLARAPVRSSPASAKPVTSQPGGKGHGTHTGTTDLFRIASTAVVDGGHGGW
jgi:hypothetical protein